jgi:outer membrane protein, multidrug efflux system
MLRNWGLLVVALIGVARVAQASDDQADPLQTPVAPSTIRLHQFTLPECLSLADRNFPSLWAARAKLANVHAQLDEAKWTPYSQWSASSSFGLMPPLQGSVLFPQSTLAARNISTVTNLQPFFNFNVNGTIPLFTWGKIDNAVRAAEANVRVNEWDMEKAKQQVHMDVRRAWFGLQLARDAKYVVDDAIGRIDKGVKGIRDKIAKGDPNVGEVDALRLETYEQDVVAQSLSAPKGEAYALAALRFMTGVETGFDVVDQPLKRPDRPLVGIAQYLEAARILRPDVNMARAGVVARSALVDYNRGKLLPDFGIGLGADYAVSPAATQQNSAFAWDPFNHFWYWVGLGLKWNLDLLPQAARTRQAESQLEETRALERLALGNAEYEVEKAYADAVEAKGREEAWDRAEHLAKQWIVTVQDHIDLGTMDERSLLEPLKAYGNARVAHLYALMDLNVTMSNLALVSGWDSSAPGGS